jgi:hypothetical protein
MLVEIGVPTFFKLWTVTRVVPSSQSFPVLLCYGWLAVDTGLEVVNEEPHEKGRVWEDDQQPENPQEPITVC